MRLYRDFETQEAIDHEYNPSARVAESGAILEAWGERAEAALARLDGRLGLPYGPTRAEYLDLFRAGEGAPLHIFLHGGYWRRFSARDHAFVAPPLVEAGLSVAVVNYALCPEVSLGEIVRQCRAAIAWLWTHADELGVDRERMSLSGHSAGGHLAAMAVLTDWPGQYDRPEDIIKAAVPISGLFDLRPFPYSYLQPALQLDWGTVLAASPIDHVRPLPTPLLVAVGGAESAEFRRQSRGFEAAWRGAGNVSRLIEIEGAHHFSALEALESPTSVLHRGLLALIGR